MRYLLCLATLGLAVQCQSQTIDADKNASLPARALYSSGGFPLNSFKYTKVSSGTAYYSDNWMKGALATADSVQYANVRLKLDLMDNSVVYMNDRGEEMICTSPVVKVMLRDSLTGKSHYFINASSIAGADKGWYEALTGGKATLYKQYFKDMIESKPYGSSITEQTIRTSERYFININNMLVRIKKPADIIEQLPVKDQKSVSDYIQGNKLNGKKESDFILAVEYYNSLP